MMFSPLSSVIAHHKSGRLRPLGVSSRSRFDAVPEYPTIAEAALPGYEFTNWYGLVVPSGTPKNIVTQLHGEAVKALNRPEARKRLIDDGYNVVGDAPETFGAFIRAEIEKLAKIIKESGTTVN